MDSYLDTALARIRTGVRLTWARGHWFVIGPKGESWGAYDREEAILVYMLCCSLADLPPSEHIYVSGHIGAGWP